MSHNRNNAIIAAVLILVGLIGLARALKDRKNTKALPSPSNELTKRDTQYLVVSIVALLAGVALLVVRHQHSSDSMSSMMF